ncbi:beta-xylosidase [Jackrogersella minutella]|nr:beta-xylosidase [Jackrogersella minutella]
MKLDVSNEYKTPRKENDVPEHYPEHGFYEESRSLASRGLSPLSGWGISTEPDFPEPYHQWLHLDLSCIFVSEFDETWFCASSSFLAFPGLPLPGMAFLPKATSDIYAPTLRFHEGTFYLLTTLDPYNSDAWSDPVYFSFPEFDPSPFWDDDGAMYVTGAHTAAYYPGIMHAPLNFETGEIGEITMSWNGTGRASPEGPCIFKRDGWYYLLLAEGDNPLLTTANNTVSYFQAVGHSDLFQDANGRWWGVALAVRVGSTYGEAPYFANFPVGRQIPVYTPVSGEMSGWPLPAEAVADKGEGQLSDADDNVTFPPESRLPIHFVHWRLPKARNYAISPPGHWNTLALTSSVLNLTGFDGDYALGRGQMFVGRRMAHSLFRFRVDVGVSAIQDQAQPFDLGIVTLKPSSSSHGNGNSTGTAGLQPYLRFRGHSEAPYRGVTSVPSETYPLPEVWAGHKITLQIEVVNGTHFAFSVAPAGRDNELRIFGCCRGDELVPYYSGTLI